jgi:hypothetical protein
VLVITPARGTHLAGRWYLPMKPRWLVTGAVLLCLMVQPAAAQESPLTCADDDRVCELGAPAAPQPGVEVAGVQATPDDARQPEEDEPFIINSGFGD